MQYVARIYKNAYSGLSPATWWLSLVMLINRSGTMVVPFMTLYLTQQRHYGIAKAGLVMAIFGAGAIVGGVSGGKLTDKLGFYNVQLSALVCGGIMFLVLGQMQQYGAICVCTFFLAVLNESFRPANSTAIAHYSNEGNRTRCYSLNRLAINLGWALGGAFGGFIASKNYNMLFWIDGLTNIGAAILLRAVLAPQRNKQTPAFSKEKMKNKESGRPAYKDKVYLVFIFFSILLAIIFFQLFTTLPVFYREQMHFTPSFIGIIMSVNGLLIAMFEMAIVFKLEQKNRFLSAMGAGTLLMALSFVVFNIFPGGWAVAILSTLLMTFGEMVAMPFMNTFMVNRTNKNNRGQYAGMLTASWSIAQVLGPYFGTHIVEWYGYNTLWWGVGVMGIVTASGYKWLEIRIGKV
jgi:predicted MFS family arabinose efflux permease